MITNARQVHDERIAETQQSFAFHIRHPAEVYVHPARTILGRSSAIVFPVDRILDGDVFLAGDLRFRPRDRLGELCRFLRMKILVSERERPLCRVCRQRRWDRPRHKARSCNDYKCAAGT